MPLDVNHIFSYHAPTDVQAVHYKALRQAAKDFADAILAHTPPSADQTDAIRKVRETLFIANASVALDGRIYTTQSFPPS